MSSIFTRIIRGAAGKDHSYKGYRPPMPSYQLLDSEVPLAAPTSEVIINSTPISTEAPAIVQQVEAPQGFLAGNSTALFPAKKPVKNETSLQESLQDACKFATTLVENREQGYVPQPSLRNTGNAGATVPCGHGRTETFFGIPRVRVSPEVSSGVNAIPVFGN